MISNPIGTSINHTIYFMWLTILGLNMKFKIDNIFKKLFTFFPIDSSKLFHLIIPNREL